LSVVLALGACGGDDEPRSEDVRRPAAKPPTQSEGREATTAAPSTTGIRDARPDQKRSDCCDRSKDPSRRTEGDGGSSQPDERGDPAQQGGEEQEMSDAGTGDPAR